MHFTAGAHTSGSLRKECPSTRSRATRRTCFGRDVSTSQRLCFRPLGKHLEHVLARASWALTASDIQTYEVVFYVRVENTSASVIRLAVRRTTLAGGAAFRMTE